MRLICHETNNLRLQMIAKPKPNYSNALIPYSRQNQSHKRWINDSELTSLNPYLFKKIVPEHHDAFVLAKDLDNYGPIVLCSPGSAAYIPLCLSAHFKHLIIPLPGCPTKSTDSYHKDFSAYSNVTFVWPDSPKTWGWNDDFTINPDIILLAIQAIHRKLKLSNGT